jgi:hypothetical protein
MRFKRKISDIYSSLALFASGFLYCFVYIGDDVYGGTQPLSRVRDNVFLIGIFSTLSEKHKMETIAKTMLGKDLPVSTKNHLCGLNQFLISKKPNRCRIIYTFVVGGNSSASTTVNMNSRDVVISDVTSFEFDLTVLNIKENMNDGKTPSWFYYTSLIIDDDIDYVAKLDLDTFISIPNLLRTVMYDLPKRNDLIELSVYGGVLMDFFACGGMKLKAQCGPIRKKYFMSGQFYFVSYDIVLDTALWKQDITRRFEDLDFGLRVWNHKRSLNAITFNKQNFWIHYVKNLSEWNQIFLKVKRENWNISIPYQDNIK